MNDPMIDGYQLFAAAAVALVAYRWWNGRRRKRRGPAFRAGETLGVRRAVGVNQPPGITTGNARGPVRRNDLIESLCAQSGWLLAGREADRYWVRSGGALPSPAIMVRYREGFASVAFQAWFSVRFSLEREPPGLFARLMIRNFDLVWTAWAVAIGESCEACPCLVARLPAAALNAALFGEVCREIAEETHAFRQELNSKFRYGMGGAAAEGRGQPGRGGVPMRMPQDGDLPEVLS